MPRSARLDFTAAIVITVVLSFPMNVPAKGRIVASAGTSPSSFRHAPKNLEALQAALIPFLTTRADNMHPPVAAQNPSKEIYLPSDADLFELARNWGGLDKSFRELYISAVNIPDHFLVHISPSNHFEIYYATMSEDSLGNAVDSTDTSGFSTTNWRTRTPQPNGVPDYVDEVAWALDSAWLMIVDRFGFREPIPYTKGEHNSPRYKIVLKEMGGYYGRTYAIPTSTDGFASLMEIENDWAEEIWSNPPLDYANRPHEAAYVTCAHEFMHAVQYSMAYDVTKYIDDYPLGWVEGAAVMMEELAFGHVDDYIQYSGDFFIEHTDGILDPHASPSELKAYKNVLFTLYTYQHASTVPGIDFVWTVHEKRYRMRSPFHENILAGAAAVNRRWSELLGAFFTDSYFTGGRADTGRFIEDAALFGQWWAPTDPPGGNEGTTKIIEPYAMQTFCYEPLPSQPDTQFVSFFCTDPEAAGDLDVRLILEAPESSMKVVPFVRNDSLRGIYKIEQWQSYERLIVVAANADPLTDRSVTVFFSDSAITNFPDQEDPTTLAVYPNPVSHHRNKAVSFESEDLLEVTLFSLDGRRIRRAIINHKDNASINRFIWDLRNERGETVLPGTYIALIGRKDPRTKGMRYQRNKIMVVP
ncbi:MAG: hypothetical protein GF344_20380 [Chitinivibrionales bacterium]|nr:hypothetical protein [Chitinivibrionales bacterium]MBD3358959.1 hypothetical protein [Chitinivibrionales bacterium]